MYESGNNQALLNMTGLHYEFLYKLLNKCKNKWDSQTFDEKTTVIRKKQGNVLTSFLGRPRDLDAIGGFGLVLAWYRYKGPCN